MAVRKETYSSKLALKDVVSGRPKVGRIPHHPPIFSYTENTQSTSVVEVLFSFFGGSKRRVPDRPYSKLVVVSARVLFQEHDWRDNTRGQLRRGYAINDKKPKKQPTGIKITKAVRTESPNVEKIVAGLMDLVLQSSRKRRPPNDS